MNARTTVYERLLRPVLFRLDPELAHNSTIVAASGIGHVPGAVGLARKASARPHPNLHVDVHGLRFETPIGLAAGFDKNARAVRLLSALGFGHIEIGSVSAFPSVGNPKPRLFRLPADESVLVAYGVPNDGATAVSRRLASSSWSCPLGVNLVKTNDERRPPTEPEVYEDFARSARMFASQADFFTLNLSCPNAAEDRDFFDRIERVARLLGDLKVSAPGVPIFLKLKPTLEDGWLAELVSACDPFPAVAGFAINLPSGGLNGRRLVGEYGHLQGTAGAVSGPPVRGLVDDVLRTMRATVGAESRYALIAAGGVNSGAEAYAKIRMGASLVQLYTTLIYQGPGQVRRVTNELSALVASDGYSSVSEAIGVDA